MTTKRPATRLARMICSVLMPASVALALACAGPRTAPAHANGGVPASPHALLGEVATAIHQPASRIELTIDPRLQHIAEEEMAGLAADWRPAAFTAIVLDPSKGELLALAGAPTARRAYVTGSTLKTVLIAAALEHGAVRLDETFDCAERSYGSQKLSDPSAHGSLGLSEVLEVSSNVGASRVLDELGPTHFDDVLSRLHFGDAPTVELPGVERGDAPAISKMGAFQAGLAASGEVLAATPLHMTAVYGAIANGGEYVAPTLVRAVVGEDGHINARKPSRERVVRAEAARSVMQMLERAVQGDIGTGKGARLQGVRVAGKTGTAGWTTAEGSEHVYASFIGIVPADAPRYVILVGVEDPRDGGSGAKVAAPAFARIAARALAMR